MGVGGTACPEDSTSQTDGPKCRFREDIPRINSSVLNSNSGSGIQSNHNQDGGSNNTQFNGTTIYYFENRPEIDPGKLCREALFLTNPEIDRANLIKAKGMRVAGTCEWITKTKTYNSWRSGELPLLWICGSPGTGKTMLSIFLTEELEKESEVIYYFCKHDDEKRNNASAVLRGMLWQVFSKHPDLAHNFLRYFECHDMTRATLSSPEMLWNMFAKVMRETSLATTFCVLDGMDACDQDSIQWLVSRIVHFTSGDKSGLDKSALRIVIVSRNAIPGLKRSPQLQLDVDATEQISTDVKTFVSIRVQELSEQFELDDRSRKYVERELLERAEGTFIWVGPTMTELSNKQTFGEVEEALYDIPRELCAHYYRMLHAINPRHQRTIAEILHCVITTARPLSLLELAIVTGCQPTESLTAEQNILDHVKMCNPLLCIRNGRVVLVHSSAGEYLLRQDRDDCHSLEQVHLNVSPDIRDTSKLVATVRWHAIGTYLVLDEDSNPCFAYQTRDVLNAQASVGRGKNLTSRSPSYDLEEIVLEPLLRHSCIQSRVDIWISKAMAAVFSSLCSLFATLLYGLLDLMVYLIGWVIFGKAADA